MFSWLFGRKRDNPETSSEEQGHIDDCDELATKMKKSVDKKPKSRSKDDSDIFTESELSEDTEDEERNSTSHTKKMIMNKVKFY